MTTTDNTDLIYCVKCKVKTDNVDAERVTMKNGRGATRAMCAVCGTKKFRIGAAPAHRQETGELSNAP